MTKNLQLLLILPSKIQLKYKKGNNMVINLKDKNKIRNLIINGYCILFTIYHINL